MASQFLTTAQGRCSVAFSERTWRNGMRCHASRTSFSAPLVRTGQLAKRKQCHAAHHKYAQGREPLGLDHGDASPPFTLAEQKKNADLLCTTQTGRSTTGLSPTRGSIASILPLLVVFCERRLDGSERERKGVCPSVSFWNSTVWIGCSGKMTCQFGK